MSKKYNRKKLDSFKRFGAIKNCLSAFNLIQQLDFDN